MNCPECGAPDQNGKYCAECGADLGGECAACGEKAAPGASYCTACGAKLPAGRGGGGGLAASRAAWILAAAAALVVVLVLFLPREADEIAPPGTAAGSGAPPGMGPLSADMRTNADRLFNRIMLAAEEGDQAEVEQFMPMAIQAYGMVEDLDADGMYHLAILQSTAGDYPAAIRTAERILADEPDHILALGVAASAASESGDAATARSYWERLLAAYPAEVDRPLPEYLDHEQMLTEYRGMAEAASGS